MRRRGILAAFTGLAGVAAAPLPAFGTPRRPRRVRTGIEVLAQDRYRLLGGQRVGVVTNPTGVLPDLRHEIDVMAASDDVDVVAVFGPEHGFRGTAQAGGSEGYFVDPKTKLPVYDTFETSGQELADIFRRSTADTIVFDVQDVGPRFYTYIWTMFDSMVAAVLAGKRFVVLDRPNPITGRAASGPVLRPEYATFIGREAVSQVHGMTVGELARLFNTEFLPRHAGREVDLSIVEMRGWRRDMSFDETGLPWVLPSPNMPTLDTAWVYPGTCLFSGTNLSQGRGTTRPFQIVGAPFVDHRWAEALTALRLPGLEFREAYFVPTFSTYQGVACGGVDIGVVDGPNVDAVRLGIALLWTLKRLYPDEFAWRDEGTGGVHRYWIDNLTGSDGVRTALDAGRSIDEVVAGWRDELARFRNIRDQYLLYR